jgi:branched-chain amino acid transport system substrate-binding protein
MKINKIIISFISAAVILLSTSDVSVAKVVGDKIVVGAAIS